MTGEYVDIAGHPTWVDVREGDGPTLLMLHGGLTSSENSWGLPGSSLADLLAPHFRIVMFDRRGHGRTGDTDAPFHYASMADETGGVIEALELAPVNVVGYSDGANLLLHLALARPELLRAMVLVSANYHHDALHPEVATSLDEGLAPGGFLAKPYEALSPDGPEHWPVVAAKGTRMGVFEEPTFTPHDLTGIAVPTLVMSGDDDMFPASHTVSLYEALPNARLAIVPNASHLLVLEHPALVAEIITAFLQSPNRQPTFLPYRRPPIGA